ncbi:MAG: SDR family oxidoreductase [Sulfobacillus sp.]
MSQYPIYEGTIARQQQPLAIITGATRGLGRALARCLLDQGWAVAFCGRTVPQIVQNVSEWSPLGPVLGIAGDLSDEKFVDVLIPMVVNHWGRLDAVVNNASTLGNLPLPSIRQMDGNNFREVLKMNVVVPLQLVSAALPHLDRTGGMSLAISSDAAVGGYSGWAAYGGAKAALDLAYLTLANEEPHLKFYTVDPGDMDTTMHHEAIPDDPGPLRNPGDVAKALSMLFLHPQVEPAAFPSGTRLKVVKSERELRLEAEI